MTDSTGQSGQSVNRQDEPINTDEVENVQVANRMNPTHYDIPTLIEVIL